TAASLREIRIPQPPLPLSLSLSLSLPPSHHYVAAALRCAHLPPGTARAQSAAGIHACTTRSPAASTNGMNASSFLIVWPDRAFSPSPAYSRRASTLSTTI